MSNPPEGALGRIREDIDEIDDAMLALLAKRFAAVEQVRAIKAKAGDITQSPMRPAREAQILRRLVAGKAGLVPQDLRVRLWRAIISAATLLQAPLRIHVSTGLFSSVALRLMLRDHFGTTPITDHPGEGQALASLVANQGDVAVVALDSPWLEPFLAGRAGSGQVIAALPQMAEGPMPRLLVFGHATAEPTGSDETLLITDGQLPRDFAPAPLWQMRIGNKRLASLPGFLSETSMPLIGLKRSNVPLALTVLGRYPSPIEVRS